TKFHSTIERGEGAIEALQRASAQGDARRDDFRAHLTKSRQGATLIDVADRAPFPLPGTHALFEGGVIELALVVELVEQGLGLAKRRVQAITKRATASRSLAGHSRNVRSTCDTRRCRKRETRPLPQIADR